MASQPSAAPKKSSFSVSRIILLVVLAGALVCLGLDQFAKYRMGRAYTELENQNLQNEAANVLSLPEGKVREIMAREPTRTYDSGVQAVEEYDYPGVFYVYRVTVKFRKLRKGSNEYDGHTKQSIFRITGE